MGFLSGVESSRFVTTRLYRFEKPLLNSFDRRANQSCLPSDIGFEKSEPVRHVPQILFHGECACRASLYSIRLIGV